MNYINVLISMDPIASMLGPWSETNGIWSTILKFGLVTIMAFIIGCERAEKRHSAGLRTFVLVSFASCLASTLDLILIEALGTSSPLFSAATLIAIALLSTNSILFSSRGQIKGLTTSVGLWSCVLIGLACGTGLYTISIIAFIFLYAILAFFPTFEAYLKNRSNHFEVHLELKHPTSIQDFVSVSRKLGLRIDDLEGNPAYNGAGLYVYTVTFTITSMELKKYKTHKEIIEALSSLDYIYHIEEMV